MSDDTAQKSDKSADRKFDTNEALDYGITTSQVTYYHYGAYRYANLRDAIAEAQRDMAKSSL